MSFLRQRSSVSLLTFVAAADAVLWLAGFPFELYCRAQLSGNDTDTTFLFGTLIANAVLLAIIASAFAATMELLRRGVTRPVRIARSPLFRGRSRPSGY